MPETVTVTEYVPVELDLKDVINPLLEMRPDNSDLQIKTDIIDLYDVVENSNQYLLAWELWQSYAEALEDALVGIQTTYGPKDPSEKT